MTMQEVASHSSGWRNVVCERCDEPVASPYVMAVVDAPVCIGCMTEGELNQLGRDLDKAMAVDRLFHREPPRIDGWEFAIHRRAARYLSGDLFDVHDHGDRFSLAVGDVMGKGLPAAMVRVVLQSGFRAIEARESNAVGLVNTARSLLDSSDASMGLVSLFSAQLVPSNGELSYVNAGHPPPLIVRDGSGSIERLLATAPILGFDSTRLVTHRESRRLTMAPGDMLVAFSDGVTETESRAGELYDSDRLVRALSSAGRGRQTSLVDICRAVVEDIERFDSAGNEDDRTLVMVRRGYERGE